jgi:hypothetical protein
MHQAHFRLPIEPAAGFPRWQTRVDQALVNEHSNTPSPRHSDLFAALLKRQAREVMRCVTECPAAQIAAHVARAQDWRQIAHQAITAGFVDHDEGRLSGPNLIHCQTVADHLAALDITLREHRAPAFVSAEARELADINRKLDTLASWLARGQA